MKSIQEQKRFLPIESIKPPFSYGSPMVFLCFSTGIINQQGFVLLLAPRLTVAPLDSRQRCRSCDSSLGFLHLRTQFGRQKTDKQKHRQTDRQTNRQTDRQPTSQPASQAGRQAGRQTD